MKTMWKWALLGLVVLLFLTLTRREGFDATDTIKDPATWDAAELLRIRGMVFGGVMFLTDADIRTVVGGFWPKWKEATSQLTMADVNAYLDSQPAAAQYRATYSNLIKSYYIDQGQSVFQQARGYVASYSTPTEPGGVAVTTGGVTVTEPQPQPPASTPSEGIQRPSLANESFRQDVSVYASVRVQDTEAMNVYLTYAQKFYDEVYLPKEATLKTSEPDLDTEIAGFVDTINVMEIPERLRAGFKPALTSILDSQFSPSLPSGFVESPEPGSAAETVPGSSGSGTISGTTTGGSSGQTYGPTSGSTGAGRTVWGPIFKGIGSGPGPQGGDSSKTNVYPELLGGLQGRSGSRLEGVGVVPPSGFGLGAILPSSAALGTDPNSRFLPFSRQPGDQDLIPDPYRLATNFSTSSYSQSKTDPVPFLTDFSSFYK